MVLSIWISVAARNVSKSLSYQYRRRFDRRWDRNCLPVFWRVLTFGVPFYQSLLSDSNVNFFLDTHDYHLPSRKNFETSFSSMSAFFIMRINAQGKEKKNGLCKREKWFLFTIGLLFGSTRATTQGCLVRNWKGWSMINLVVYFSEGGWPIHFANAAFFLECTSCTLRLLFFFCVEVWSWTGQVSGFGKIEVHCVVTLLDFAWHVCIINWQGISNA